MRRTVKFLSLVLVGAPFVVCQLSAAQQPSPETPSAQHSEADYTISAGDVLRISVWKEAELSGDAVVRLDGKVTVQLLGDVQAIGRTPNELSRDIGDRLARFLAAPHVTVTVSEAVSARFYVLGEVLKSGAIPLVRRTTITQAIALAGGFKEFAKKDHIVIIREKAPRWDLSAIAFNFNEVESGVKLEQNITVQAGDTILVP
jgi:polysaccharide export outer membrane protein